VRALKDACLREFQLWELVVKDGRGVLICSRDSEDVAFRAVIETTDFPIAYVHLYVKAGCSCCHPSTDGSPRDSESAFACKARRILPKPESSPGLALTNSRCDASGQRRKTR